MVIYFMGHVGAFAGPLPYDYAECAKRAHDMRQEQHAAVLRGDIPAGALQVACVFLAEAPKIAEGT